MKLSRTAKGLLTAATVLVLAFIYVPLVLVAINSFNTDTTFGWPPSGFTTKWWSSALHNEGVLSALKTSVLVAFASMATALVLGTLLALALQRYRFFGRNAVSLLVVLPIALPGIVTGIALSNLFTTMLGMGLSLMTVIVAHATFCIVTVFNNVQARLGRMGSSLEEASADLGAGTLRTFWSVTVPQLRSALLAGGLLAFALSFDEIIVTTFTISAGDQTLPIWILQNMFRPNQSPIVNVVAVVLIVVSVIPIWLAQKLSGDAAHVA